jgi:hypothetical protein
MSSNPAPTPSGGKINTIVSLFRSLATWCSTSGIEDGLFFFQDSGIVHADDSIRDSHIWQDLHKSKGKG